MKNDVVIKKTMVLLVLLIASSSVFGDFTGIYGLPFPKQGRIDMKTHADLKGSMELAGQNLIDGLNPYDNYLPLRAINMDPKGDFVYASYDGCLPRHDLGRWWDAMLRLEDATGFEIPAHIEGAMLRNLYRYFDNEFHVLRNPGREDEGFDFHSFRENLLALNALVRFRNSAWARQKGHLMVQEILDGRTPLPFPNHVLSGRMIEAVVWFYEATGDPAALKLADRLAKAHLEDVTRPDGGKVLSEGHTHSYLNTLRGLLLYGELTDQQEYIERVAITYRNAVQTMITRSGFTAHDIEGHQGETGSTGDVAQLALWLATRHGYTEFFDDVERIVRARLLPSQVIECPKLTPRKADKDYQGTLLMPYGGSAEGKVGGKLLPDTYRDLEKRAIGAYGGCHRLPHAWKIPTQDVTAANIHTLVDIYQHIATRDAGGIRVRFHFDYDDDTINISSTRNQTARVVISPKVVDNLWLRIPRWTPKASVKIAIDGKETDISMVGDYAFLSKDLLPGTIVLTYALPVEIETESIAGVDYQLLWRGDEVMGITPNDFILPFYPTYVPDAQTAN